MAEPTRCSLPRPCHTALHPPGLRDPVRGVRLDQCQGHRPGVGQDDAQHHGWVGRGSGSCSGAAGRTRGGGRVGMWGPDTAWHALQGCRRWWRGRNQPNRSAAASPASPQISRSRRTRPWRRGARASQPSTVSCAGLRTRLCAGHGLLRQAPADLGPSLPRAVLTACSHASPVALPSSCPAITSVMGINLDTLRPEPCGEATPLAAHQFVVCAWHALVKSKALLLLPGMASMQWRATQRLAAIPARR